jgi:23S rRNA pseudouridine1911/1915/1917 synthase
VSALHVLWTDNHLLAVAKPAGVPVVPDSSGDPSLLDAARVWVERQFQKPGRAYLGVVHRLDRPVSGVVLFARTSKAAARLSEQFRTGAVQKLYWGVTAGDVRGEQGTLEQWLVKDKQTKRVRVVAPGSEHDAKRAVTEWRVLRRARGATLLELRPRTGRPHQLRLAALTLGAPLAGDLKYGAREPLPDKSIALHAVELTLEHPTLHEPRTFRSEPPALAVWEIANDEPRWTSNHGGG